MHPAFPFLPGLHIPCPISPEFTYLQHQIKITPLPISSCLVFHPNLTHQFKRHHPSSTLGSTHSFTHTFALKPPTHPTHLIGIHLLTQPPAHPINTHSSSSLPRWGPGFKPSLQSFPSSSTRSPNLDQPIGSNLAIYLIQGKKDSRPIRCRCIPLLFLESLSIGKEPKKKKTCTLLASLRSKLRFLIKRLNICNHTLCLLPSPTALPPPLIPSILLTGTAN